MKLNDNVLAVIGEVAKVKGNRIAKVVYTSKESGEKAIHTILLGFSYHNSVVRSLEKVKSFNFAAGSIEAQAQAELIASFEKTLAAHEVGQQNADYTKKDVYDNVALNGVEVGGVRYNQNDGSFKLFGLTIGKIVLEKGVFKTVKSAPLTIAKNKMRKALPIGKFREYAIEENALATAKLNKQVLNIG